VPDAVDELLAELDTAGCWPLDRELHVHNTLRQRRALRTGDKTWLRTLGGWDIDRPIVHDSLARRIAFGFADFLYGRDPDIIAADESDQRTLDEAIEENRLAARLHRAERMIVSEGEAWWKLHVNRAVAPCALLTWTSRLYVVPLLYGDRVLACAFVTQRAKDYEPGEKPDDPPIEIIYRHAEIHGPGRVINVLYKGTPEELGRRVALDSRPETAGYNPEWNHGLPMIAGRIVNDFEDDECLGVSDYDQVMDELIALDEAITTSVENTRLTAVDRVAVSGEFTRQDGSFDASMQVFQVRSEGGETLGEGGKSGVPLAYLEKRYDAEPLWLHITKLVQTILSRVGLVAEFIGDNDRSGQAPSGAAIRLRFIPTTNAAEGKLREHRHDVPHIAELILQIAKLPAANGGFGQSVTVSGPPAVEFADILPQDESETTTDVSTAVTAEVMSRRTAIRTLHPEWDDEQIDDELADIQRDLGQEPDKPSPGPESDPEPEEDPNAAASGT
jgi:hypothetical protein